MTKLEEYEALQRDLERDTKSIFDHLEWDDMDQEEGEAMDDEDSMLREDPNGDIDMEGPTGGNETGDDEDDNNDLLPDLDTGKGLDEQDEDVVRCLSDDEENEEEGGDTDEDTDEEEGGEGQGGETTAGGEGEGSNTAPKMSARQLTKLLKALEKQQEFLDGDVKKTNVGKKDQKAIETAISSDASVEQVKAPGGWYNRDREEDVDVVVIRKVTEASKGICGMFNTHKGWGSDDAVNDGIRLGTMLGKKLKVRNDDVTTQVNRQRKGRIDKRLLAEFGVGNTRLFENTYTTTTNDCGIHISIDASGSMGGDRWRNALKTAVSIAKAADMVGGIRVRIDVRSIDNCKLHRKGSGAVVLIAYDSKVNKFMHIKKMFPYLQVSGGTPEGLCFEAIMDIIKQGGSNTDRYFINMSDGAPSGNYVDLTRNAVKKMKQSGMEVLSYFIGCGTNRNSTFDTMYGDSASYVDTNNITEIAKTINKLLAQRG